MCGATRNLANRAAKAVQVSRQTASSESFAQTCVQRCGLYSSSLRKCTIDGLGISCGKAKML